MRKKTSPTWIFLGLLNILIILLSMKPAGAEMLSANAALESTHVYVGESFIFQIQVEGHDAPSEPDISPIKDFTVQFLGGQQNSRSSITIINGKITQNVQRGFNFSYRLTPKKSGMLTIPSILVTADDLIAQTQALHLNVSKPTETEDFKLRFHLSEKKVYVGQAITLTVSWYVGKDVEAFQFALPVLKDPRFKVADWDIPIDPNKKNRYVRIPLEGMEVIGEKIQKSLDGKEYLTIEFQKILIPKKPGKIRLPQGTVTVKAVMGHQTRQPSKSPFGNLFQDDFFFGGRRNTTYKKIVVPSNEPLLTISKLPEMGRPTDFTGLVGNYKISSTATPTNVRVGDPITLTLKVTGPDYLKNIHLAPLHKLPYLNRDFKIPEDMSPGKEMGRGMVFTQTLRAKHPGVQEIPSLQLSYFDPNKRAYVIAKSNPIPLRVNPTRVVTARDAEGLVAQEAIKSKLESSIEGIAHNYEDLSVLENKIHGPALWLQSPLWMTGIGLPPTLYTLLLIGLTVKRRLRSNPDNLKAKRAYGKLKADLEKHQRNKSADPFESYTGLLDIFRQFLASKLHLSAEAITFGDIEGKLQGKNVSRKTVEDIRQIFHHCEAGRYAGASGKEPIPSSIIEETLSVAQKLEQELK